MIQEIVKNLYKIVIPLPAALLGSVNVFLFKGRNRNLLVDTGLHDEKCREALFGNLEKLSVNLENTDFFITHHHADHFGLLSHLTRDGSAVYIHRSDVISIEKIGSHAASDELRQFLSIADFPEHDPGKLIPSDVSSNYNMPRNCSVRFVTGGDELNIGDFRLLCLHTPGHTNGHMCLYEPEKKILVSGDHLLGDITPSIQLRNVTDNPLLAYLNTFEMLNLMDVELVLPGHCTNFTNFKDRIRELKAHHKIRESEILAALAESGKTVYEIASQITWNIAEYSGWDSVPLLQKLFATGEAMAHLKHLEERGVVKKCMKGPGIVYSATG